MPKRKCKKCNKNLSKYNPGDVCQCHFDDFVEVVREKDYENRGTK